ncbi:hypothetical protein [Ruegeria atlantica]|uniref:hypothetical protein n=1 Tax=Ruegeria atlantica TaxID=81569 RepID=UPI00249538CB|nr:hypothetical protein [Ruegeria atlantica]
MALEYDRRIEQLTGQAFSDAYVQNILGNPDEMLESSLTACAAALVHDQGAKAEMTLAHVLQRARYAGGVSAVDLEAIRKALTEFGIDGSLDEGRDQARKISKQAAKLQARFGTQGVPTLLMHTDGGITQVDISSYHTLPEQIAALAA